MSPGKLGEAKSASVPKAVRAPSLAGQGPWDGQVPLATPFTETSGCSGYAPPPGFRYAPTPQYLWEPRGPFRPPVLTFGCQLVPEAAYPARMRELRARYVAVIGELFAHQRTMDKDFDDVLAALDRATAYLAAQDPEHSVTLEQLEIDLWDLRLLVQNTSETIDRSLAFFGQMRYTDTRTPEAAAAERRQAMADVAAGRPPRAFTTPWTQEDDAAFVDATLHSEFAGWLGGAQYMRAQWQVALAKVQFDIAVLYPDAYGATELKEIEKRSGYKMPAGWRRMAKSMRSAGRSILRYAWDKVAMLAKQIKTTLLSRNSLYAAMIYVLALALGGPLAPLASVIYSSIEGLAFAQSTAQFFSQATDLLVFLCELLSDSRWGMAFVVYVCGFYLKPLAKWLCANVTAVAQLLDVISVVVATIAKSVAFLGRVMSRAARTVDGWLDKASDMLEPGWRGTDQAAEEGAARAGKPLPSKTERQESAIDSMSLALASICYGVSFFSGVWLTAACRTVETAARLGNVAISAAEMGGDVAKAATGLTATAAWVVEQSVLTSQRWVHGVTERFNGWLKAARELPAFSLPSATDILQSIPGLSSVLRELMLLLRALFTSFREATRDGFDLFLSLCKSAFSSIGRLVTDPNVIRQLIDADMDQKLASIEANLAQNLTAYMEGHWSEYAKAQQLFDEAKWDERRLERGEVRSCVLPGIWCTETTVQSIEAKRQEAEKLSAALDQGRQAVVDTAKGQRDAVETERAERHRLWKVQSDQVEQTFTELVVQHFQKHQALWLFGIGGLACLAVATARTNETAPSTVRRTGVADLPVMAETWLWPAFGEEPGSADSKIEAPRDLRSWRGALDPAAMILTEDRGLRLLLMARRGLENPGPLLHDPDLSVAEQKLRDAKAAEQLDRMIAAYSSTTPDLARLIERKQAFDADIRAREASEDGHRPDERALAEAERRQAEDVARLRAGHAVASRSRPGVLERATSVALLQPQARLAQLSRHARQGRRGEAGSVTLAAPVPATSAGSVTFTPSLFL